MLFVGATFFFEFADPQLDGGSDFPRTLTAGLFQLTMTEASTLEAIERQQFYRLCAN